MEEALNIWADMYNKADKEKFNLMLENAKLKQLIISINKLAENAYCLTNGTNKEMARFANQILQKINEVDNGTNP